jgi:hypothetical protein
LSWCSKAKSTEGYPVVKCRKGDKRLRYKGGFYKEASAKPRVKVLCWNHHFPPGGPDAGPPDIRSTPKKCSLYRDGYAYEAAGAVHMRKLRWKHWGARTTVAKGQYAQPMDVHDPWKPIRVRLKRKVERCGRTVYAKAMFHSAGFKFSFPIWTC